MAKPLRTVWLEPEEQPIAPKPALEPRRRRQLSDAALRRSGLVIAAIILVVGITVIGVGKCVQTRSSIAQYEFDRQAMRAHMHQLQLESAQLKLNIAAVDNANEIALVAQQANMVFPPADQVQYVQVANAFSVAAPQSAAQASHRSWLGQVSASLGNIFQRFGHGTAPAYAQD